VTRVIWTREAVEDVEAITPYVARDSVRYASLLAERVVAAVGRLESFPESGRVVVDGDIDEVSRRLAGSPALATTPSDAGASRQDPSAFFFADIAHYLYARDTALHMAAAAFRRPVAELLVAYGADCRARNRRSAEPLHYAADANRWNPTTQAETIEYLVSIGADPNAVDRGGVTPLHRAVRTRSLPAVRALLDGGANPKKPNKRGSTPLHLHRRNSRLAIGEISCGRCREGGWLTDSCSRRAAPRSR